MKESAKAIEGRIETFLMVLPLDFSVSIPLNFITKPIVQE
jgi:hypothetical protein